ncbi:MAG: alpha/beta hydrolase [Caldilineaceae bacterium]|nr:alpha/beta hydrolase [Caldilineaceae bacterium]
MLTEKTLPTSDGTIHYVEGPPNGRPLVLIHGFTGRWQLHLPLMHNLALRYHLFAPDLRGHGQSSWTPGAYHLNDYVADISALVRTRTDQSAVLVGHSFGGAVALAAAAAALDAVAAVVAVDPPLAILTDDSSSIAGVRNYLAALRALRQTEGTDGEKLARLAAFRPDYDQLTLHRQHQQLTQFDPEQFTWVLEDRMFRGLDLATLLPRIPCPVLLLQCNPALGGVLHNATAQTAAALLPDCIHVYRPDVGHLIPQEQPVQLAQMVADFVEIL